VPPEEPVLDCACGIGTQTLGLLSHGWTVIGTDLSRGAISRARTEAIRRGVRLPVAVADMRGLPFAEASVAALVCADNSLPHLTTPSDLATGLDEFRRVLRPGGVALISTRDYDRARQDPPSSTPPGVHDSRQGRVITFQLWHWHDDGERYDLEHFQLVEVPEGSWRVTRRTTTYWAITRDQLTSALTDAGFSTATWLEPAGSGFFQPLVVARRA
jgi:SAM-dependent methyltransferase